MVGLLRFGESSIEDDDDDGDEEDEDEDEFCVFFSNEIIFKGYIKVCYFCLLEFRGWFINEMYDISWMFIY